MSVPEDSVRRNSRVGAWGTWIHYAVWVVQWFLALAFLISGFAKLALPISILMLARSWVRAVPVAFVRFLGIAELAGAFGIVVPAATRLAPRLSAAAAVGLASLMAAAFALHVLRGEVALSIRALVLGLLAVFVAWGRFVRVPFRDRNVHLVEQEAA